MLSIWWWIWKNLYFNWRKRLILCLCHITWAWTIGHKKVNWSQKGNIWRGKRFIDTAAEWNQINGFQVIWQQGSFIAYLPLTVGRRKTQDEYFIDFVFGELLNFILKILVQANFFSSIEKVCITEWSMTITDKRILRMYRLKCINIVNRDKSTTLINICQRLWFLYFNYLRAVSKCEKE